MCAMRVRVILCFILISLFLFFTPKVNAEEGISFAALLAAEEKNVAACSGVKLLHKSGASIF